MKRGRNIFAVILSIALGFMPIAEDVAWAQSSSINTGVPASDSNLNSLVVRQLALAAANDFNALIGGHVQTTLAGCTSSPVQFQDCLVLGPPVTWYKYYSSGWQPVGTFSPSFAPTVPATTVIAAAVAPVGGLVIYAAPTAIGSGNCLSSGNACTLAAACALQPQIATFLGRVSIQLLDGSGGSYASATAGALCTISGNGGGSSSQLVSITGNPVSPTNVVLQVPAGGANGFIVQDGAEVGINNLEITAVNGAGPGIGCKQLSLVDYNNVTWGSWGNSGVHVSADGCRINAINETLTANGVVHWNLSAYSNLAALGTTNVPSAVSFSAGDFISAINSNVDLSGWTLSGAGVGGSTGNSSFAGAGYLTTAGNAACASILTFGSCSFTFGYQDGAGEGMTGTGIVVGQSQPIIDGPIVKAHTYGGLPGSPTAGQIEHIVDGLAADCSDGACTTPNATVTLGGGGLDLLIAWDGAAWRIFRAQAVPSLNNLLGPLNVAHGGTGNATATAHSLPVSEGTSAQNALGPCTTSQVIIGAGSSADPTCGSVPAAALPNPSASTLGGIQSLVATAHQWINAISTSGVPSSTQPTFGDIGGTVQASQLPTPTASTLGGIESIVSLAHNWIAYIDTSGVPHQSQPGCGDLSDATTPCNGSAAAVKAYVTPGLIYYTITGVNFNSGTTDNAVPLSNFPSGMTRFFVNTIGISNASHSLTGATAGVFTTTGGSGAIASDQALTVSSTSDATSGNGQSLTLSGANTTSYLLANLAHTPNLYVRVGTPEGAAATGDVTIVIRPAP